MALTELLAEWRPGSFDEPWTWQDEHDHLWFGDPSKSGRTDELATSIQAEGIREPILLGSDGRVWDGHHRVVIAMRLGIESVPVERAGQTAGKGDVDGVR